MTGREKPDYHHRSFKNGSARRAQGGNMNKKELIIREEDIRKSIKRFMEDGGLIKKLPDEIVPPNLLIGSEYGMFENVNETYFS